MHHSFRNTSLLFSSANALTSIQDVKLLWIVFLNLIVDIDHYQRKVLPLYLLGTCYFPPLSFWFCSIGHGVIYEIFITVLISNKGFSASTFWSQQADSMDAQKSCSLFIWCSLSFGKCTSEWRVNIHSSQYNYHV